MSKKNLINIYNTIQNLVSIVVKVVYKSFSSCKISDTI